MMNSSFDLLSLPRRNQLNYGSMEKKLGSGLPINSLPGWELIPLNSKLPMLKCPGNQVIFSKDKIGQSLLKALKHDFDTSAQEKIPEYNPLHDLNLRNFYANENNLKRLRVNGEITENNDVICTLKDFNEYRQQIHKSFIYYLLKEMRRLNNEQNDRKLINYASNVTGNDYANINLRTQSYHQILARREQVHEERMRRYQVSLQRTQDKFQRIAERQQMNENLLKHKKYLHDLKMRQHTEARDELQRKKLIYVKKLFQFKKQRFQRAIRNLVEHKNKTDLERETELWEKRLSGRIAYQQHINELMERKKNDRDLFIQNHIEHYRALWSKIQMDIKQRTHLSRMGGKKKKKKLNRRGSVEYITSRKQAILIQLSPSASDERIKNTTQDNMFQFELYDQSLATTDRPNTNETSDGLSSIDSKNDLEERNEMREKFNNMVEEELVHVLNKAIDIQGNAHLPFDKNDPTYKVASFIVNFIIKTMQTDLSTNRRAMKDLTQRVLKYFNDVKTFILYRASQIIAEKRDNVFRMRESIQSKRNRPSHVSFSRFSSTIGISSYAINPHVNLRRVQTRKPTPVGSLASILAAENKTTPSYEMSRVDIVFMEYYHVKFKRELSVSIGKRVFAAIEGHFRGERTMVRKELLELDKSYLAQIAAEAILGHAVNKLNFFSALKLCSSALTADIIWSLQRQLLRPDRDVKGSKLQKPKSKDWLCLFYDYDYREHFEGEPIPPSEGLINKD